MLRWIIEKIKKNRYKLLAAVSFGLAGYFIYRSYNDEHKIKLSTFLNALSSDRVDNVVVKGEKIFFKSEMSDWYYSNIGNYPINSLFNQLKQSKVTFSCQEDTTADLAKISTLLFSPLVFIYYIDKILNQHGKKQFKKQGRPAGRESFQSFFGNQKIKTYLKQVIQSFKNPSKYLEMGVRTRRGLLLHGPPGTGKTLLARIIANQSGLDFYSASGSQFEEIFVGVGPKRIRDIFNLARLSPNGSIIFIDQIDAIGSRSEVWQTKQQRSTINQLLTELDGFTQDSKIFIIGATNNIHLVDTALIRPGRFDLKLFIPKPNDQERQGILETLIKEKKLSIKIQKEQLSQIAKKTEGWCGADLENLLNESGYTALRKNQRSVSFQTMKETLGQLNEKVRQ